MYKVFLEIFAENFEMIFEILHNNFQNFPEIFLKM